MKPELAYQSKVGLIAGSPEAVVIHCCDYRFQAAMREFVLEGLGIRSYDVVALPGGAHFASMEMEVLIPKQMKVGKDSLKFLIEHHQPERLILIDHADCAFFKDRLAFFFSEPSLNDRQRANMKKAHDVLQDWFPRVTVETYFAEASGDHSVSFTKIG